MPQSRIRLFVVGFKEKSNFEFPQPIKLEKKMKKNARHAILFIISIENFIVKLQCLFMPVCHVFD